MSLAKTSGQAQLGTARDTETRAAAHAEFRYLVTLFKMSVIFFFFAFAASTCC